MRRNGALGVLLALIASATAAQGWRGSETVEIQVSDPKGRPIQDARITFTFQGVPGELGPDIVATEARGRAVLADLAPGPWKVEVVHPDYLSYIAMVDVRRGKKPLVSASFLEAGGRSLTPMKVKVGKGNPGQASPSLEARRPAEPAPIPAPSTPDEPRVAQAEPLMDEPVAPMAAPETPPPPPAEPAAEAPPPPTVEPEAEQTEPAQAPALEPPEAAIAQVEAPVAEPHAEAGVETTAPEPPPVPQTVPSMPAEPARDEEPAAEAPPPPTVEPEAPRREAPITAPPTATTALPAPPDPGLRVASFRDGACSDCSPGEWTLTITQPVAASAADAAGRCGPEVVAAARPALIGLSSSIQLELDGFIGPVADGSVEEAVARAEGDLASSFAGELAPFVRGASPCQVVAVVLPKRLRFSRAQLAASDRTGRGDCSAGGECRIGAARWVGTVQVESGPSTTVVWGLFHNLATDRARRAHLTVYFRPPDANWEPRLPAR